MFGYFKVSGTEWSGVERNGTKLLFHCLVILQQNGTKFPFHHLDHEWSEMDYKTIIPFLPLFTKTLFRKQMDIISTSEK